MSNNEEQDQEVKDIVRQLSPLIRELQETKMEGHRLNTILNSLQAQQNEVRLQKINNEQRQVDLKNQINELSNRVKPPKEENV